MKTKQQAIQEAYGEYWEKCNPDENGWSLSDNSAFYPEIEFSPENHYYWRPKSLQGIENNNGWIRIETEDDLPKEDGLYITGFLSLDNLFTEHKFKHTPKQLQDGFLAKCVTHYQPYKKPKPPIY